MPRDEQELCAILRDAGISWVRFAHPPLHTVEDSQALRGQIAGAHIKNMFLKARRGDLVLVSCLEERRIRLADLEKEIGVRRCSFASEALLMDVLGVKPGAVTPLALFNDKDSHRVRVVFDRQMLSMDPVNCHPLHNEATFSISSADVLRITELTGHKVDIVDFDALEAKQAARASVAGD